MVALITLLPLACLQAASGQDIFWSEASSDMNFTSSSPQSDEAFLTRYKPWVMEFRQNPLTAAYVLMADAFPVAPVFLNMFVRGIFPGGRIRIPVNEDFSGTTTLHVDYLTLTDLDHIKSGKVSMVKDTRYTWFLNLQWEKLTAIVEGTEKNAFGKECPVTVTVPMKNVTAEIVAVIGLNKTRVCEQWMGLQEEARCALWSVIYDPWRMVTGVKATQMRVYMDDFDVVPKADCADESTNKMMEDTLKTYMIAQKPVILYNLKNGNAGVVATTNQVLYDATAAEHADKRCNMDGKGLFGVNKVCTSSSTSSLQWSLLDCPMCALSQRTQHKLSSQQCQSVGQLYPDAVEGESLRVLMNSSHPSLLPLRLRYEPTAQDTQLDCDDSGCVARHVSTPGSGGSAWWLVAVGSCLLLGFAAVGLFVKRRRQRGVHEDLETSLQAVVN